MIQNLYCDSYFRHYSWFHITFPWMLRTSFWTSLWSSKVHTEIHKPVCKQSLWLVPNKNKPIRGFVYKPACEFQYKLLNFTTKFGTSLQHSRKNHVKSTVIVKLPWDNTNKLYYIKPPTHYSTLFVATWIWMWPLNAIAIGLFWDQLISKYTASIIHKSILII
jgi:hypothetical protein